MHSIFSFNKKAPSKKLLLTKIASSDAKVAIQHYFMSHKEELWQSFVNALVDMLPLDIDMQCSPITTCTFNVTGSSVNDVFIFADKNVINEVEFAICLNLTVNKS